MRTGRIHSCTVRLLAGGRVVAEGSASSDGARSLRVALELTAFGRIAADAELAPSVSAKAELARFATVEFAHFDRLCARFRELGADPDEAMAPYGDAYDGFHDRTRPADWLEAVPVSTRVNSPANDDESVIQPEGELLGAQATLL